MRRVLRAIRVVTWPLWFEALLLIADADHEMKASNKPQTGRRIPAGAPH